MDQWGRSSESWDASLSFAEDIDPDRRLAGLSVAARAAAEAVSGGATSVTLRLRRDPSPASLDDLARVCGALPFRIDPADVAPAAAVVAVACGPFIARGADLAALVGSAKGLLVFNGTVIAARTGDCAGTLQAGDALDLARPRRFIRKILLETAKAGDGPVSRWLNRPVSRALSALLLPLPRLRPFHASMATAVTALLMFAMLLGGGERGLVIGALLYQAASILDGVDGEVARATFRTSRAGAVLDTVIDAGTNLLFVIGFSLNVGSGGSLEVKVLAIWGLSLFVLGLTLIAWRSARAPGAFSLDLVKHHYARRFKGRLVPALIRFATIVASRDFYAFLFMVLILIGLPISVLYLFATAATVWILFVLCSTLSAPSPAAAAPSSDFLRKA